jgi:hypothetical protein
MKGFPIKKQEPTVGGQQLKTDPGLGKTNWLEEVITHCASHCKLCAFHQRYFACALDIYPIFYSLIPSNCQCQKTIIFPQWSHYHPTRVSNSCY